jgi:hypothetical protein
VLDGEADIERYRRGRDVLGGRGEGRIGLG